MAQLPRVGAILNATYRLDALLTTGGTAAVFRATHLALQKPFAVKVLVPPPGASTRFFEQFRVEAETLGQLSHPAIVSVTDFGIDPQGEGLPYLVMELIEGQTLDALCSDTPMPLAKAAPILETIASAIDAAHAAGVVHGDITTRNVVVTSDANGEHPVLIDFGLAREAIEAERSSSGMDPYLAGTVPYLAPEIVRGGSQTTASDIYAFAVLAYRVLTGREPFSGSRPDVLEAHVADAPPAPSRHVPSLPHTVDAVIIGALAKSPHSRPRAAAEITQTLSRSARHVVRKAWLRHELPRRGAAALLVAVAVAATHSWLERIDLLRRLQGIAFDTQVRWSSPRDPDRRLLLVSFDDRTLAADSTPLPNRADEVGERLTRLMAAGASVVGVDLLLPAHWGESRSFADLVLRHAPRLALAVAQDGNERVGPEVIGGLVAAALGPDAARRLFASVNVEPDVDGVVRFARVFRETSDGGRQPTLAGRLAGWPDERRLTNLQDRALIDYRLERRALERLSWVDLEARLRDDPDMFAGRLVLVGAEFAGAGDRHLAPRPGGPPTDVTGLEQQAIIAATFLSPSRLSTPTGWQQTVAVSLLVLLATGLGVVTLLRARPVPVLATTAAAVAVWVAGAAIAVSGDVVVPVAVPVAQLGATLLVTALWSPRWSSPPERRWLVREGASGSRLVPRP
jgi:serine/threonine-protein kinase